MLAQGVTIRVRGHYLIPHARGRYLIPYRCMEHCPIILLSWEAEPRNWYWHKNCDSSWVWLIYLYDSSELDILPPGISRPTFWTWLIDPWSGRTWEMRLYCNAVMYEWCHLLCCNLQATVYEVYWWMIRYVPYVVVRAGTSRSRKARSWEFQTDCE